MQSFFPGSPWSRGDLFSALWSSLALLLLPQLHLFPLSLIVRLWPSIPASGQAKGIFGHVPPTVPQGDGHLWRQKRTCIYFVTAQSERGQIEGRNGKGPGGLSCDVWQGSRREKAKWEKANSHWDVGSKRHSKKQRHALHWKVFGKWGSFSNSFLKVSLHYTA